METQVVRSTQRNGVLTAVCLTAFFLFLSIFTMGISQTDNSWYLSDGVALRVNHFLGLHYWSPLYALWFRLLSFAVPDPVARYFASWALLMVMVALLPVVFRVRYAWLYTLIFTVVPFTKIDPFIGMFAGVICLGVTCAVLRCKALRFPEALEIACLTCFILGYCRSEFDFGVFLSATATLVAVAREWRGLKGRPATEPRVTRLRAIALAVVVVSAFTAFVMSRADGQRSGVAFAQHYNRRAALRGQIPPTILSWQSDYAERMFGVDAGRNASNGKASLGDFFRAKPGLFLTHVADNIDDPKTVLVLLLLTGTLAWPWIRPEARGLRPASLFLGAIVAPAVMDMVVIYPRDHYAMILLPSVAIVALQAIRSERWLQPPMPWALLAGVFVMLYIDIRIPRQRFELPTEEQIGLSQVECVRKIDRGVPQTYAHVFDSVGIRDVYLATPRTQTDQWKLAQWNDFERWVRETHPGWITVDEGLAAHYGTTPAHVQTVLADELGYVAHPCTTQAHMTIYTPKVE